jgi:uncharacterized membrane protein
VESLPLLWQHVRLTDLGMDWQTLLAHRHWFTLEFGARRIRLCARCTGTVAGYFLFTVLLQVLDLTGFHALPSFLQFFLSFTLGLPSAIDWLAQTWRLKDSTNARRVMVGALIGAGAALLTVSTLPRTLKTIALAGPASATILVGYLGRKIRS